MVLHAAVARLEVTFRFDIFIVQSLGGYFFGTQCSNSNSHDNVYGAVIVAVHCHYKSSPGSFGKCSLSVGLPLIFGPGRSA